MRSFLTKLQVLFISSLAAHFRILSGLVILAVLTGRSAPEPVTHRSPRQPAHPRYLDIGRIGSPHREDNTPRLLDTETGAVNACPLPGAWGDVQLSCSPWRGGEGQYQLVGQCLDNASGSYAMVRCTFPAGRVLDRVALDVMPIGRPCWSPDQRDRVLFAGGDGLLYLYDFPAARGARSPDSVPPRELQCQIDPPGVGRVMLRDPCWPTVSALDGRLLVAMHFQEDLRRPALRVKLWWLQLSPGGGEIVSAECAIVPDATGPALPQDEERLPCVGMTRDGTPLLAYLAHDPARGDWELWVMPIAPAASRQGPRVVASAGRRRAQGCAMALAPAFSADGRWIYVSRLVGGTIRLERFDVAVAAEVPTCTAGRPAPL